MSEGRFVAGDDYRLRAYRGLQHLDWLRRVRDASRGFYPTVFFAFLTAAHLFRAASAIFLRASALRRRFLATGATCARSASFAVAQRFRCASAMRARASALKRRRPLRRAVVTCAATATVVFFRGLPGPLRPSTPRT